LSARGSFEPTGLPPTAYPFGETSGPRTARKPDTLPAGRQGRGCRFFGRPNCYNGGMLPPTEPSKRMMKAPSIWGFLILALIGTQPAHGASVFYSIDFLPASGVAPASGSFDFDSTTDAFTNFDVVWAGISFDLDAAANSFAGTGGADCATGQTGAGAVFELLTSCTGTIWYGTQCALPCGPFGSQFTFESSAFNIVLRSDLEPFGGHQIGSGSFTASSTPEPGTATLVLVALGWLLLFQKRMACGFFARFRSRTWNKRLHGEHDWTEAAP